MKYIKQIILSLVLMGGVGLVLMPSPVSAVDVYKDACGASTVGNPICDSTKTDDIGVIIKNVVNVLLYLLGATAVIIIIIAGIMYTTSGGNPTGVTRAKNMLLYAVVGLVVALLAYAIVNFVIAQFA